MERRVLVLWWTTLTSENASVPAAFQKGMTQEQLANEVGVVVTHISHIETGNTKLSLPVLVDLADALQIRVDDLLFDSPRDSVSSTGDELQQLLDGCNAQQAKAILDIAKSAKTALEKYY